MDTHIAPDPRPPSAVGRPTRRVAGWSTARLAGHAAAYGLDVDRGCRAALLAAVAAHVYRVAA